MTIDTVNFISGLLGFAVFLYCFVFVYLKGTTKNQKTVRKWESQGGKTVGTLVEGKVARHGDINESGTYYRENLYKATYKYKVNGKAYYVTLHFSQDYPGKVIVYYDPLKPEKCLTANQATAAAQKGHGCLVTIIATIVTIGVSGNLLLKLFG